MAFLLLDEKPVLGAVITMPLVGAWTAELAVDAHEVPAGPVALSAAGGRQTWAGTAYRSGIHRDALLVRVIGGAGGLATELEPKFYRNTALRLPFSDALQAGGERAASSSSPAVLGKPLAAWSRARGPVGEALRALAAAAGAHWRVLADGSVWIGTETWPAAQLEYQDLEQEPQTGRFELWAEVPSLVPGVALGGRCITKVEHRLEGDRFRTTAWVEADDVAADDPVAALESLVRHMTSHVDYFAQYAAVVVAQNLDGSLELQPDDPRLPGLTQVPIRYGIPGVKATVAPGARVFVAFEAGNPARPVATLWESASILGLTFDGSLVAGPVARAGLDTAGPWPIVGGNPKVKA